MKNIIKLIILITIVFTTLFTSCKKYNFDAPAEAGCDLDFEPNISIKDLFELYPGFKNGVVAIDTNLIIKGTVIANDKSGNLYKSLIIQDSTETGIQRGLQISINEYESHNKYHVGDMIYIKCNGLYLGNYGEVAQLGSLYEGAVGRIEEPSINLHLFNACGGKPIVPKIISITQVNSIPVNTLIKLEDIQFLRSEFGQTFGDNEHHTTSDQYISDCNKLAEVNVRTSGYAKFASQAIPEGFGSIIVINGSYRGDAQLLIRDISEVKMDNDRCGYYPIYNERFDSDLGNFNQYSVIGSGDFWKYDSRYGAVMNGNRHNNEDWMISNAIDLTEFSEVRFSFRHALNYKTSNGYDDTEVYVCNDYDGTSNPNTSGTWVKLEGINYPTGNSWSWSGSGYIDISNYGGTGNFFVAFKYTSTSASCTWEIDDIEISVPE